MFLQVLNWEKVNDKARLGPGDPGEEPPIRIRDQGLCPSSANECCVNLSKSFAHWYCSFIFKLKRLDQDSYSQLFVGQRPLWDSAENYEPFSPQKHKDNYK